MDRDDSACACQLMGVLRQAVKGILHVLGVGLGKDIETPRGLKNASLVHRQGNR